jgi:hypothetical protein
MNKRKTLISAIALLMLALSLAPSAPTQAQGGSRLFPETGKTVRGIFLQYWQTRGGLAQQGYPISEEMQEVSETDGKTYTVQYFERAVFERHPEFAGTPNEVLLSLLGVFYYNAKYPSGAPNQQANNEPGSTLFPETGRRVGGKFLAYWRSRGGLAQQGFPISEEFMEVSPLDGKTYRVQYFQRAVFEFHPEFAGTPNEVLLSQLGTFRYRDKYLTPPTPTAAPATPTALPPTAAPPTSVPPTSVPPTAVPPTVPANPCADVPQSTRMLIVVLDANRRVQRVSNCEKGGVDLGFIGTGFRPGENIGVYFTAPDQSVYGTPFQVQADSAGVSQGVILRTFADMPPGIWATTMEGVDSGNKAIGYFRILAP